MPSFSSPSRRSSEIPRGQRSRTVSSMRWLHGSGGLTVLILASLLVLRGSAMAFTPSSPLGWINVKADFGATGDGVTDDSPAVQAAVAAAGAGAEVFFPPGVYVIGKTISATNVDGLRLVGAGVDLTIIEASSSMGGLPMIELTNGYNCTVQSLSIWGNEFSAPSAGIESVVDHGLTSHLTIRDVDITTPTLNSMVNGVVFADADGDDQNNENGFFENVEVGNYTHAAYVFGHLNSEIHNFVGGAIGPGPIGVYSVGAGFKMTGTHFGNISQSDIDLTNPPDSGVYTHDVILNGISAEGDAQLLTTGTTLVNVFINGFEANSGYTPGPTINFESPGLLSVSNSKLTGSFVFGNPESKIAITNSELAITSISWAGHMGVSNDCFENLESLLPSGAATISETNPLCGAIDPPRPTPEPTPEPKKCKKHPKKC